MSKRSSTKKYYAVSKGRLVGIFEEWSSVKNSTEGHSGNCYKGYPSLDEAIDHMLQYNHARDSILVHDRKGQVYTLQEYTASVANEDILDSNNDDFPENTTSPTNSTNSTPDANASTIISKDPATNDVNRLYVDLSRSTVTNGDTCTSGKVTPVTNDSANRPSPLERTGSKHPNTVTHEITHQTDKDQMVYATKEKVCAYCGSDLEKLTRATERLDKSLASILPQLNDVKRSVDNTSSSSEASVNNTKIIMNDILLTQATLEKLGLDNLKKTINDQGKSINAAISNILAPTTAASQILETIQKENAKYQESTANSFKKILEELSTTRKELDLLGNYVEAKMEGDTLVKQTGNQVEAKIEDEALVKQVTAPSPAKKP